MHARPVLYTAAAAALLLAAGSACATPAADPAASIYTASPASIQPLNTNVLPVIVRVSKQGKITYVSPAYELRSRYQRLLRTTLEQLITQPAHGKDGVPIASEFIMYVTGKTTKRADGKYDFQFTYVSAKPIPFGNWIWGQFTSGRLALLSPDYNLYGFPRQRSFTRGQCYYGNAFYRTCAVYTCIDYTSCNENPSDNDKSDKNGKDDNKSKDTGTAIAAASTKIYRLHRPTIANRAPRTPMRGRRARMQSLDGPNVAPAGRVGALMAPTNAGVRGMQSVPARGASGSSGAARRAPPEPISRGSIP